MKLRHMSLLIVFVLMAAVAVAGCGGSSTTGPTATPTPGPGATALTTGSIFDSSNLNFYEWHWTSTSDGKTETFSWRREKGTDTLNGVPAKTVTTSFVDNNGEKQTIVAYYSKADNSLLGAKIGDQMMPAEAAQGLAQSLDAWDMGTAWAKSNYPITNPIPETLTINGKTYVCQKYSVGNFGANWAVWVAQNVPVAVQFRYADAKGNSVMYQLWDWG